jgi:hypothetical protein
MTQIKLNLTKVEWCEVANALESKIRLVQRGDYGEGDAEGENEKWIEDMQGALRKLIKELHKNKISW